MYDLNDGAYLIKLARNAIDTYFKYKKVVFDNSNEKLLQNSGVFVTLEEKSTKELRGCMGFALPIKPLSAATTESAINAAFFDTRFLPLKPNEINNVLVEVSILGQLQQLAGNRIEYPEIIKVGKDGLFVQKDGLNSIILPQIATQEKWNSEEFLCQVCYKAGISPDSWLERNTNIYIFQTQTFAETSPDGKVIELK